MAKMVPKPLGLGWFPINVGPNHPPSFIHRVYMEIVVPKPLGLGWFPFDVVPISLVTRMVPNHYNSCTHMVPSIWRYWFPNHL